MQQNKKNFHRHFAAPGLNLYWIIIAYIIVGWFYPVVGLIALICMIGPVMTSIWKQHLERALVVRTRMSSRQLVRPSVVEVLTPQANTCIRAYVRLPPIHGVLYLWHVRPPTHIHRSLERGRISDVERYRARILDDYRDDNHCRHYAEFHLCATHLVLVLSDGYYLQLGGS